MFCRGQNQPKEKEPRRMNEYEVLNHSKARTGGRDGRSLPSGDKKKELQSRLDL